MSDRHKFEHEEKHDKHEKCKVHIHHHHHHCPMHMPMPCPGMEMPMPEMIRPERRMPMPCPPMEMPMPEMIKPERRMPMPCPPMEMPMPCPPMEMPMPEMPTPYIGPEPLTIPPPPATCAGQFYMIMRGETLTSIARKFGTTVNAILRVNPQITNPDIIFEGQRICLPVIGPPVMCPGGTIYVVMAGDTLTSIAARFGVTVAQILAANPAITNPDVIFAGQQICIPSGAPGPCAGGQIYVVVSGDTLFSIARRFNTTVAAIVAANPQITNPDVIFPGQRICIPAR